MSARFSAIVFPVTVNVSPCKYPASSKILRTTGIPPTRSRSVITNLPNGLRSPSNGTLAPIRLKSSSVKSTSASWAIASKCRTAFVEPPSAIKIVIAFSNAFLVKIIRVVIPRRIKLTTASPDLIAYASRLRSTAGGAADPGKERPSASPIAAIVLAVYIPPQAPSPGQIARSI